MAPPPSLQCQKPAHEYTKLLQDGQLTSQDLVGVFLDQIDRHNHRGTRLNAIVSVCPRHVAMSRARQLDDERRQGTVRSDLHGMPIVLKDAIVTHPALGMTTSAGACAIASLKPTRNASLVGRLLDAGLIVIGKGNLTEFCGLKDENTPIGWSAYGGQTLSPYRRDDLKDEDQPWCGGSSVGPAVSVAAGFAPLGIGTETGGSNVFPASVNGLYGLTLPHSSVPIDGVSRISEFADRIGLVARDPQDLLALGRVLLAEKAPAIQQDETRPQDLWKGVSIGILDSQWGTDPESSWKWGSVEVKEQYASVAKRLESLGATVIFPLENPPQPDVLKHNGEGLHGVSYYEFASVLEDFISTNFEPDPELKNLADLVTWNEAHAEQAMPEPYTTQTELLKCLHSPISRQAHDTAVVVLRHKAREETMAAYMRTHNLDIVLSGSDASLISFSSCAGWPVATVPVANLAKNDQPWGFFVLARDGRLDLLARFMRGFHESFEEARGPVGPFR